MGFVTDRSCVLHFSFPSPSSSSRSRSWVIYAPNKSNFRGIRAPMACSHQEHPKRRFFSLLGLKANALEGLHIKENEGKTPEHNPSHEITPKAAGSSHFLLSSIGRFTITTLFLGFALGYAVNREERAEAFATVEKMRKKQKQQEVVISLVEKNYELRLHNERKQLTMQLEEAKDEQNALMNKLNLANSTISFIEQEMRSKEDVIEELKLQIGNLETQLAMANAEKTDSVETSEERLYLLSLVSYVEEKESEIRSLNSHYKQTKDELSNSQLQIQGLKDELQKIQEKLEAKDSSVNDLNSSVKSLTLENNDLKWENSVMEENAASYAKLLRVKEKELHQLKKMFEHALDEGSRNQAIIAQLTRETEILQKSLENESKKENSLMSELQIAQDNLGQTIDEAAQLEEHIKESNIMQKELEVEVSKLSAELSEAKESLQKSLINEEDRVEILTSELRTAKEDLKKSQDELQSMSLLLKAAQENSSSLQRELVDVYKKAETAVKDLEEEKMLVTSLNKHVQALESETSKEREARRSLEMNLEKATKSQEEINQQALILSDQLERYNSRILNLEDDHKVLHKLLTEQQDASNLTQKNLEDAHDHIMTLEMEKENLESESKKLEEELASSMDEMLSLRSREISPSEVVTNDEDESEVNMNVEKEGQ